MRIPVEDEEDEKGEEDEEDKEDEYDKSYRVMIGFQEIKEGRYLVIKVIL